MAMHKLPKGDVKMQSTSMNARDVKALTFEEIEGVSAGGLPALIGVTIVRCGANSGCRSAVRAGAVGAVAAAGAGVGHFANRE